MIFGHINGMLRHVYVTDQLLRLSPPPAVAARLKSLLDRHDSGKPLTTDERAKAQSLPNNSSSNACESAWRLRLERKCAANPTCRAQRDLSSQ